MLIITIFYISIFICAIILTALYLLSFHFVEDLIDDLLDMIPFFNLSSALSFFVLFSGIGYTFEAFTNLSSILIFILSGTVSFIVSIGVLIYMRLRKIERTINIITDMGTSIFNALKKDED